MRKVSIPDEYGLFWNLPDRLIDWTNRLELRDTSGPDWRIDVVLAEFDTLPGETRDLLKLYVDYVADGEVLKVTVQGGFWLAKPSNPQLGKEALYRSARTALVYLPCWRGMRATTEVRVFAPADPFEEPWTKQGWAIGHRSLPLLQVANHYF